MDELIEKATKDYQTQFGRDLDPGWKPATEQDLIDRLSSSDVDFDRWRTRHGGMWQSLSQCALPIINLGSIASQASSAGFPPASLAIDGLLSFVTTCEKVSEAYDYVQDMFAKLADALDRWNLDFKHEVDDHLKQLIQQILVIILAIISRSKVLVKKGRMRHYMSTLVFGKDEKTAELLEQLDTLLLSEDRARLALSLDKLNSLWTKAVTSESDRTIQRLHSPVVETNAKNYAERAEQKMRGTGSWISNERLYLDWLSNKLSLLLLLGGPGAGKSFLATSIIETLSEASVQSEQTRISESVAFFFVNNSSSLLSMLEVLAYQIQVSNPAFRNHLVAVYEQNTLHTAKAVWKELFLGFWNAKSNETEDLMLVIDGLDEMNEDDADVFAQDMAKELPRDTSNHIRIIICGRESLWATFDYVSRDAYIRTGVEKNGDDLYAYIEQGLGKIRRLKNQKQEVKKAFQNRIHECSDGNFEWARLLLAKIKPMDERQINRILEKPPKGLDDMIKSCLDQTIENEELESDVLSVIFAWLIYSKRPLAFGELYHFVCLETNEEYPLFWYHMVRNLSTLVEWRSLRLLQHDPEDMPEESIEELDEEIGWSSQLSKTVIRFRHARIREYIIQCYSSEAQESDGILRLPSEAEFHCTAVKHCLEVLRDEEMQLSQDKSLPAIAARDLFLYLRLLNIEEVGQQDRAKILSGLLWLLYNPAGHESYLSAICNERKDVVHFWNTWIATNKYSKIVQRWLRLFTESQMSCSKEQHIWMDNSVASIRLMLRPLSRTMAQRLMATDVETHWFDEYGAFVNFRDLVRFFLVAHGEMSDDGECIATYHTFTEQYLYQASIDHTIAIAQSCEAAHDTRYHLVIAYMLWRAGKSLVAQDYAKKAFEQDDQSWSAAWIVALTYWDMSIVQEALSWSEVARGLNANSAPMEASTAGWLRKINRPLDAFKAAKKAYELDPANCVVAAQYLDCSMICDDVVNSMKAWRQANDTKSDHLRYTSQLIAILLEGSSRPWAYLGYAYKYSATDEDKKWILSSIQSATSVVAQTCDEAEQITWALYADSFHMAYVKQGRDRTDPMLIKTLFSRVKRDRQLLDPNIWASQFVNISLHLAVWEFRQAQLRIAAGEAVSSATLVFFENLVEDISKSGLNSSDIDSLVYQRQAQMPSLFYARLLRDASSGNDTVRWRDPVRPIIQGYISMLEDATTGNDMYGLWNLMVMLFLVGDTIGAMPLESLLVCHMRTGLSGPRQSAEIETCYQKIALESAAGLTSEDILDLSFEMRLCHECDICSVNTLYVAKMFTCPLCNFTFCNSCVPTSPEQKILGQRCGSHHGLRQTWPPVYEDLHWALAVINDKVCLRKNWLAKVKQDYSID